MLDCCFCLVEVNDLEVVAIDIAVVVVGM